ncbi:GNAT family N-acetyltransferase [Mucilaginibacter sp. UYCu711]|uniref:GNAT family N-acetyltransferase n=1 Tax=Mucilaginibacter sp. UYCu711 TaxID=3156339 RepID=UPI003D19B573
MKTDNRTRHLFILASENGDYFVYASYELDYEQQSITKIHKIYILPGIQGKGIGLSLMNHIENAALQASNISLSLNVIKEKIDIPEPLITSFRNSEQLVSRHCDHINSLTININIRGKIPRLQAKTLV